ncbi:MAG: DNA-binding protein [Duganella sp.]
MARAGILYSQVAKVAAQLAVAGTNPTVDTVRAALGDTGSKGTIAPMLKQWKAQHQGETAAASAGLPVDLLEAVKGVYQRLEAGAQAQVEQLRAAHEMARQEGAQQLEAERVAGGQLRAERDVLSTELAQMKAAFAHERDERQHGAVAIAALRAENDGLAQRLADRAAEVRLLTDQLAQARHQFDHFQEKVTEQRVSDRQGFEARIGMLEHDAQQLRTYLQEHQQAVAVLRAEKQGLHIQVERANDEAKENLGEVYTLREQLVAAREMASREHMDAAMTAELRAKTERENVRLNTTNGALVDEVAALKAQLEAASGAIKTPGAGKKK